MYASNLFFFFAFKTEQQYATIDKLLKITQSGKIKHKWNFFISKREILNSQNCFDCGLYRHAKSNMVVDVFFPIQFYEF